MTRALALLALLAGPSAAQAPAAAAAQPAAVSEPAPATIEQVYNGAGLRDPFIPLLGSGGGGGDVNVAQLPPPNIHVLVLKGVIAGKKGGFAMIEDSSTGARYVLRADGKLYDVTGKAVAGITGSIKSAKSVLLTTKADNDVQWLQLPE